MQVCAVLEGGNMSLHFEKGDSVPNYILVLVVSVYCHYFYVEYMKHL
jgi:hypothetical protein